MRIVLAFEVKRLPETVDEAFPEAVHNGTTHESRPAAAHA